MSKHTPIPWKVQPCPNLIEKFFTHQVMYAKDVVAYVTGRTAEDEEANASLISVAPEMKWALTVAFDSINPSDKDGINMFERKKRLDHASELITAVLNKVDE